MSQIASGPWRRSRRSSRSSWDRIPVFASAATIRSTGDCARSSAYSGERGDIILESGRARAFPGRDCATGILRWRQSVAGASRRRPLGMVAASGPFPSSATWSFHFLGVAGNVRRIGKSYLIHLAEDLGYGLSGTGDFEDSASFRRGQSSALCIFATGGSHLARGRETALRSLGRAARRAERNSPPPRRPFFFEGAPCRSRTKI